MSLHPVIAAIVEKSKGMPALSDGTLGAARAHLTLGRATLGDRPSLGSVADVEITADGGPIGTRVLRSAESVAGVIIFLRGGGWVRPSIHTPNRRRS